VFDRFVVGLLLLLVGVAGAAVLLTALGVFDPALVLGRYGPAVKEAVLLPRLPMGLGRVVAGVAGALVGLGAVMMLARRIVPSSLQPSTEHHILSTDDKGLVLVDKRGICTIAGEAIRRVPGVVDVNVRVLGGGVSAVRLIAQTWVHAGVELTRAGDEAREQAREAVEKLVGLEVLDVVVRLHVVPLEDLDRVVE
jgi:uncharacterized alkaline shock family protein YloU